MLLRYQLKSALHMFRAEPAVVIVAAGFFVVALLVMLGEYFGFLCGFRYLAGEASPCRTPVVESQAYFADAITFYSIEVFFGAVFLIGMIAAGLSALATFWHARDTVWLASAPWSAWKVVRERLPAYLLLVSWPPLVLALPLMFALGAARGAPFLFYGGAMLVVFLFLLLIAGAGLILATLLVRILGELSRLRTVVGLLLVLVGIFFGLRALILPADLIGTFQAVKLEQQKSPLEPIEEHFRLLPTHPLAELTFKLSAATLPGAARWFAVAALVTASIFGIGFLSCAALWQRSWQRLQEGTFLARAGRAPQKHTETPRRGITRKFPMRFLTGRPSAFFALLEKDFRELLRNPREVASAFFLVFLLVFYLALLTRLPEWRRTADGLSLLPFFIVMHVMGLGYFAATLALRFIFPLMGLERSHGWIAFAAPLSPAKILLEKFAFGLILLGVVIELLILFTVPSFGIPGLLFAIIIIFGAAQAYAIGTLVLGMGALDRTLGRKDPERMSTTLPGLAATILALGYIALSGGVMFRVSQALLSWNIVAAGLIAVYLFFSIALGSYFLLTAARKLAQMDMA